MIGTGILLALRPSSPRQEYALLLDTEDMLRVDLATSVLAEKGIPSFQHAPDFDVAELGTAVHGMVRGSSLFVPAQALDAARQALAEAWGEEELAARSPDPHTGEAGPKADGAP